MENINISIPDFFKNIDVSITICDTEGIVVYMNERAISVFGDKRGQSMMPCHQARSQEIIHHMLDSDSNHVYTISKNGQKKLIYQTPWHVDGRVAGLIEFSMVLPEEMPHYVRS